jgi:hypothetical protein
LDPNLIGGNGLDGGHGKCLSARQAEASPVVRAYPRVALQMAPLEFHILVAAEVTEGHDLIALAHQKNLFLAKVDVEPSRTDLIHPGHLFPFAHSRLRQLIGFQSPITGG